MLYKEILDTLVCGMPNCKHDDHENILYLHGQCHISSPTSISYFKGPYQGVLIVRCGECNKPIVDIAVANFEGEHQQHDDVWAAYERGTGILQIIKAGENKPFKEINVLSNPELN